MRVQLLRGVKGMSLSVDNSGEISVWTTAQRADYNDTLVRTPLGPIRGVAFSKIEDTPTPRPRRLARMITLELCHDVIAARVTLGRNRSTTSLPEPTGISYPRSLVLCSITLNISRLDSHARSILQKHRGSYIS